MRRGRSRARRRPIARAPVGISRSASTRRRRGRGRSGRRSAGPIRRRRSGPGCRDPAGHDWPRFPHRLGHGEAETFGEALLHDHVRAALEGVHHRRVLFDVVHRQGGEVDARLRPRIQPHALRADLGQPRRLRDRRRHRDRRPRQEQVGVRVPAVSVKQRRTPAGSLSRSQRDTCTTSGASAGNGPSWSARPRGRPVPGAVLSLNRGAARRSRRARRATIARTASGSRSWFLGEKASIDGGTSQSCSASRPSQTKPRGRKCRPRPR